MASHTQFPINCQYSDTKFTTIAVAMKKKIANSLPDSLIFTRRLVLKKTVFLRGRVR